MIFPATTSFTPLSTISLTTPHILHPKSCNPAMDLIVLLSRPSSSSSPSSAPQATTRGHMAWKGKAKDVGGDTEKTKVSLWRTGGSRVWEVDVPGRVGGVAWSKDGLFLSVLSIKSESAKSIEHLSVHTGEVIRSIPLDRKFSIGIAEDDLKDGVWIEMEWRSSELDWKAPHNGSALMMIDSLPRVTPVLPPKPPNALPFLRPTTTAPPKPTLHSSLTTFPALLPSNPPISPEILTIASQSFLTGTFPLPISFKSANTSTPGHAVLALSQISDRITGFLDVILRGLENAEQAFREGEKQTMICREDLETCAQQQAMTIPDVHADLFRFLMTGRSGVAVSEWLGNRLTGRTITKWDQVLETSFRTIQNLISESISPALERLILLLEEMKGWSRWSYYTAELQLNDSAIMEALDLLRGFAKLAEKMRKDAEHEMMAAAEFMKWLKYEIARAASQDPSSDDLPLATHDLKLVWSFMQNGFVHSSFHWHFPSLLERPPKDCLPDGFVTYPRQNKRSLADVLKETTAQLAVHQNGGRDIGTPSTRAQGSVDSNASGSMSMSMSMSMAEHNVDFGLDEDGDMTPTQPLSDDDFSRASSPDTADRKDGGDEEGEIKRSLEQEPWVWANTLVRDLDGLVRSAIGDLSSGPSVDAQKELKGLRDARAVGDGSWEAFIPKLDGVSQLWLLYKTPTTRYVSAFLLADPDPQSTDEGRITPLSLQFFDDEELVLLLESDSERYLTAVRYAELAVIDESGGLGMSEVPEELMDVGLEGLVKMGQASLEGIPPVPIARSRQLGPRPSTVTMDMIIDEVEGSSGAAAGTSEGKIQQGRAQIALNGRKGRRLGCVIQEEGTEVDVWDLDVDEDDEDNEGEEGEGSEEE